MKWKLKKDKGSDIANKIFICKNKKYDEVMMVFRQEGELQLFFSNGGSSGNDYPDDLDDLNRNIERLNEYEDMEMPPFPAELYELIPEAVFI